MRLARTVAATAGLTVATLAGPVPAALASDARSSHSLSDLISNPDATVTPNPTAPGTATTFVVSCNSVTSSGNATAATLVGTPLGLPDQIPMQQTSQPDQFVVTVNMPQSIGPGSFSLTINCNNGATQTVDLEVNAVPGNAPATGDGSTSTVTDGKLTVAGLGLLGIAAAAGGLVLRRRRPGPHISPAVGGVMTHAGGTPRAQYTNEQNRRGSGNAEDSNPARARTSQGHRDR